MRGDILKGYRDEAILNQVRDSVTSKFCDDPIADEFNEEGVIQRLQGIDEELKKAIASIVQDLVKHGYAETEGNEAMRKIITEHL